jgi:hypothetical protein
LRKIIGIPACHASPHGDAFFVVALFEQTDGEPFQPGNIVGGVTVSEATLVFAERSLKKTKQALIPSDQRKSEGTGASRTSNISQWKLPINAICLRISD